MLESPYQWGDEKPARTRRSGTPARQIVLAGAGSSRVHAREYPCSILETSVFGRFFMPIALQGMFSIQLMPPLPRGSLMRSPEFTQYGC